MQKSTTQSLTIATAGTQQPQSASISEGAIARHHSHQDIAARAYEIYLASGMQQGQCKRNWTQAEDDLQNNGHSTHVDR